jgi:DNA-binding NarL/FixJ family response regulator
MIRVLLVDDEQLVRSGIRGLLGLRDDIEVVGEAAGGEEAVAMIGALKPDVVLLDVRMPGVGGLEVLRRLAEPGPLPSAILLTTFDDDEVLLRGIRAGARGFLLKDVSLERLADAIHVVARGGTLIRPAITERIERSAERLAAPPGGWENVETLTPRELQVLRLVAGGYSNKEIGELLSTSEGTVKNQVSAVIAKLSVRDRTRAVLKGLELGLI